MERKLISVQKVLSIDPIPEADRIETISVLGWSVVAQKGLYNVGDKILYCEIDSQFPEHELFKDLERSKYRLKTIRLRGQISQGWCLPLSIIQEYDPKYELLQNEELGDYLKHFDPDLETDIYIPLEEDTEVTSILGVTKWEPPQFNSGGHNIGRRESNFPSFIPKTDEPRANSIPKIIENLAGTEFFIKEKADGCLDEECLLETKDGIKTIKEICEAEYLGKVKSFNVDKNEIIWDNIINHSILENNNDWYEIELEDNSKIKLTGNHKVYDCVSNSWIKVEELIGSEILLKN